MKKLCGALCALFLLLSGCGGPASDSTDFFAMDTFMTLTAWGDTQDDAHTVVASAEQEINRLSNALSRQVEASSLAELNAANGEIVTLDPDAYAALSRAVEYAEQTGGAFDPTTAPLSDLWGTGTDHAAVPAEADIAEALTHVGYENIELLGNNQARLLNGAQVDLGGIGKGYATDVVASLRGDAPLLAQLGGNIGAYGENPSSEDSLWTVGLANPDDSASYIATLHIQDTSIVTSGDYERYFEQDGVRYHHIFDPTTGYPAQTGLRAVTVVDEESTRADAYTTALFVMGLDKGMAFCEEHDVQAVFVTQDYKLYVTGGLQVTLADGVDYELVS
ncbi:MAG: FAD:protein FMN transferase [Butyricicoccus sp.]|nr:FAD:protein FMN transferase [Butyricicoccus sp.]